MNLVFKNIGLGLLLYSNTSFAFLGTETAVLVELVSTTASQLNELEKLVSSTEKYTEKIQKYNELAQDEYFKAQRILYLAESTASKKEIDDLGGLNGAIRDLKYSMSELQDLMKEYHKIKQEEKKTHKAVLISKKTNKEKDHLAQSQIDKSINAKSSSRANQLTAQNTAMIYESNVDIHNTQLDMLEKITTTNRLLAEQLEEERIKQIQKEESYGVKRGKK